MKLIGPYTRLKPMSKNRETSGTCSSRRYSKEVGHASLSHPGTRPGDVTMWEPVLEHSKLMVCDVIVCEVQPPAWYGPRLYGHMIHEIGTWTGGCTQWRIGNNRKPPHMDGWCAAEHIYGLPMEAVQTDESTTHMYSSTR